MTALEDELAAFIPTTWSGEQALRFVRLLNAAVRATWAVHGEDMAFALAGDALTPGDDIGLFVSHDPQRPPSELGDLDDLPF